MQKREKVSKYFVKDCINVVESKDYGIFKVFRTFVNKVKLTVNFALQFFYVLEATTHRYSANFTREQLSWSLFLIKLPALGLQLY